MKLVLAIACVAVVACAIYCFTKENMANNSDDVKNGDVIRCYATGKVFKVENGQKRWYSWRAYVHDGKPEFTMKNCSIVSAIPDGPDMPEK